MAHIVLVTGLLTGRINASFELASRLQKEGHEITFLCQPSTLEKIAANGFKARAVSEITFDYKDPRRSAMESSWFKKLWFHLKYLKSHYSEGLKILKLEEHQKLYREVNPDLALVDVEIHDMIFTAIALKIPIKLTTTWFSDTISINSPSIRTSVMPGRGFSGTKIGILMSWAVMRAKIHARVLLNRLRFENYRRWMFKTYAKRIGFDTTGLLVNTLPPLYSFTKLPIVTMTMSELEFPHKLAPNMMYIGPMVWVDRRHLPVDLAMNDRLRSIYETRRLQNGKLIYASVGSMAKDGIGFLKRIIAACEDQSDWQLVLSIGPHLSIGDFGAVAPQVHVFNWVPQPQVIANADCVVTHAGNNTMNECLHYAVPMVLYSGKKTDQDGSAARMAYHGLGRLGDKDRDTSMQIKSNIEMVLNDPSYHERIVKFNTLYQNYRNRALTPLLFEKENLKTDFVA